MGASVMQRGGDGGKRRRSHAKRRPMSEINVTPFVDVMLVLLIIFMVAAPLLKSGIDVDLPNAAAPSLPTQEEEPLIVTINDLGITHLGDTPMDEETLITTLEAIAKERNSKKVFLEADGSVEYNVVAQLMSLLSTNGFSNISLVTQTNTAPAVSNE